MDRVELARELNDAIYSGSTRHSTAGINHFCIAILKGHYKIMAEHVLAIILQMSTPMDVILQSTFILFYVINR